MNMGNTKMHNVDMWHVEVLMVESPRLLVFFNKFHTFDAENPFESEFQMMKSIFVLVDSPLLTAHSLFLAVWESTSGPTKVSDEVAKAIVGKQGSPSDWRLGSGCLFLKSSIPKSPRASILKWSNFGRFGGIPILGNLHIYYIYIIHNIYVYIYIYIYIYNHIILHTLLYIYIYTCTVYCEYYICMMYDNT